MLKTENKGKYLLPALIILLGLSIYSNSLGNNFVWDDDILIVKNRSIKNPLNIPKFYVREWLDTKGDYKNVRQGGYYRPIIMTSFATDYFVWGLNPMGYHLTNIILHIINGLLLYYLLLIHKKKMLGFISSCLFITFPMHTKAVTFISGRTDLFATCFFLLSFILYIKKERYILSYLFFFLGLLSKEIVITLPFILFFYDMIFRKKLNRKILPFFLIIPIYIILRSIFLNFNPVDILMLEKDWILRLGSVCTVFASYIFLLFFPLEMGPERFVLKTVNYSPLIFIIAILVFLSLSYRRSKEVFFLEIFFILTYLPQSNIIPIHATHYKNLLYTPDQFIYLPSIAFFVILGNCIIRGQIYFLKKNRSVPIFLICLLLIFYSSSTIKRNRYWKDEFSLWSWGVKKSPYPFRISSNLARIYGEEGKYPQALHYYQMSLQINPFFARSLTGLGVGHLRLGNIEQAENLLIQSEKLDKMIPETYFALGYLYQIRKEYAKAIENYKRSIELDRSNSDAHLSLRYCELALASKATSN